MNLFILYCTSFYYYCQAILGKYFIQYNVVDLVDNIQKLLKEKKNTSLTSIEINDYLKGKYGAAPAAINEDVRKKIIGDEPVITHRPADDISPEFANLKKQYKGIAKNDEDVLSIALFGDVAIKYLEKRNDEKVVDTIHLDA